MNLTSSVPTCSSSVNSPNASKSPGILKASSRQVGLSGRPGASTHQNSNPDAASSSQGWQWDAQLFISTGKPVPTDKDQKSLNRQENLTSAQGHLWQLNTKDVQEIPKFQKIQKVRNSKVEFGHIISVHHQIMLITWRKSS